MKRNNQIKWSIVNSKMEDIKDLQVAVLGGTGGLGRAIARKFALNGAKVTVLGRTFRDPGISNINFIEVDLNSMKAARNAAQAFPAEEYDMLIMTSGIFASPQRQETAEGLERDLAVSYLSRFIFTRELAPRLGKNRVKKSRKPRIFIIGYPGSGKIGDHSDLNAEKIYKSMDVHMNTVAGNEMLVLEGKERYWDLNIYALNPGLISTNIRSNLMGENSRKFKFMESLIGLLSQSPDEYASRIVPLLISPDIESHSGACFNRKAQSIHPSEGYTPEYIQSFFRASEELLARIGVRVNT